MRLPRLASVAVLFGLVALGCATPRKSPSPEASIPSDFSIVCGQGGGITGMWEGHTINPDGSVLAWSGRAAETDPRPVGSLTAEQRLTLWKKIEAMHFFDIQSDERGNMTSYVKVTANSRTHEVYWVPRMSEPVSASPLQQLFTLCEETASRSEAPQE